MTNLVKSNLVAPFKADVVGSYLRPERLKIARQNVVNGGISSQQLRSIEDEEITKLIEKQKASGLNVLTDGEFRRSWWHLDFFWGLNGIEKQVVSDGYNFHGVTTRAETAIIVDKLSGNNHPFVNDYKFIHQFKDDNSVPRQTIPAPAQFYRELLRNENKTNLKKFYPEYQDLFNDIITSYRTVISDLYTAGCRNVQLDDCSWGSLVDPSKRDLFKPGSKCPCGHSENPEISDFELVQEELLNLNNGVLSNWPDDLIITTHVCRGNYRSTWFASGGYESVASNLFGKENVAAYYLEFDTERAGGFECLAQITDDKKVVLGLVSSKNPELENEDVIIERIKEASKFIPLERLALSTQCGFASTEEGNSLTEEDQWNKIALVKAIAEKVWR